MIRGDPTGPDWGRQWVGDFCRRFEKVHAYYFQAGKKSVEG